MADWQGKLGASLIQHGPENDRIYLMELDDRDMPGLIGQLDDLAGREGYSKVFAKVPGRWHRHFTEAGYATEALVPGFFEGIEDGHFMSRFLSSQRAIPEARGLIDEVLSEAIARQPAEPALPPDYELRPCSPEDVETMARLYQEVFHSYPFPIDEPCFLESAMEGQVDFFGAFQEGELVALASSERSPKARNAEMTDFATHPEHRGSGLARSLLSRAEEQAAAAGAVLTYTIARALSPGMNVTFARGGYRFAGTLINNTQIAGHIESMNVWFKPLG